MFCEACAWGRGWYDTGKKLNDGHPASRTDSIFKVELCDGAAGRRWKMKLAEERVGEYNARTRTAAQLATKHQLETRDGCVMCTACGEYEYNNNNYGRSWKDTCGEARHQYRAGAIREAMKTEMWKVAEMWKLRFGLPME